MTKDYTDFRDANDAPGSILRAKSAERFEVARASGIMLANRESSPDYVRGQEFAAAAIYLMSYEIQNDVTFVTLDNGELNWLLEIVNDYQNEKDLDEKFFLAESAVRRIIDLLGLE